MKFNKVLTFLCFAWVPVFVTLLFGAEASARPNAGHQEAGFSHVEVLTAETNSALERRFSPTRYDYPSDFLGREVSLVYGAYQGRADLSEGTAARGIHEVLITAHDQGDLDNDGHDEAIVLVEESLCSSSTCKIVRHLDIWTHHAGEIIRKGRIPVSTELELESVGIQIRQSAIFLTMVDLDSDGDLREVSQQWKIAPHAPTLVETRMGEIVETGDGGC